MLIQSRSGGVGARWKQLSKLGKVAFITVAVFFLLAILWGTGTVDVDYVRNQFKSATENHESDGKLNENATPPINTEPVKANEPEKSLVQDATSSSVAPKPTKTTTPVQSYSQGPTSSFELKPVKTEPAKPQPIAGGVPLRVMFIGASMTLGVPQQSAYRMRLREWLVSLGNAVNFVGTKRFGKFKDNDVQAFASTPIQILHEKAQVAVSEMQPNLIIVNAGSSDCFQEKHWGSAHGLDYTRSLVDFLFEASPRTAVVLSTLVTSTNPRYERCIKSVNAQIRQVVTDVQREGKHILLSEQHYDQGLPGRITPEFVSSDKMHPTFEGWEMMAEIYKQDILDVDAKGWIVAPVKNGIMDDGDAERDLEDAAIAKEKVNAGNGTTTHARRLRRGHIFW